MLKTMIGSKSPHFVLDQFIRMRQLKEVQEQRVERKKCKILPLSSVDLSALRHSETLFILGSGQSIGSLSINQFEIIRKHDSIGINFWLAHEFVPKFLLLYPGGYSDRSVFELYWALMRERASDYRNTVKILTDLSRVNRPFVEGVPLSFSQGLYAAERVFPFARSSAELLLGLRKILAQGYFDLENGHLKHNRLFKYGTSLSAALGFAACMGYRRIVICGVDLYDRAYFYEDSKRYPMMRGFNGAERSAISHRHPTAEQPSRTMMSVIDTINALYEVIFEPNGVTVLVENSRSLLAKSLPVLSADAWSA